MIRLWRRFVSKYPQVRVMVGHVLASLGGSAYTSVAESVWVWSPEDTFSPKLFSGATVAEAIAAAEKFFTQST